VRIVTRNPAVPSLERVWQAVEIGVYTAIMTFLAGLLGHELHWVSVKDAQLAAQTGIAAFLAFLGWSASPIALVRSTEQEQPPQPPPAQPTETWQES